MPDRQRHRALQRATFNLKRSDRAVLRAVAKKRGTTMTGALHRAIRLMDLLDQLVESGGWVVVMERNGAQTIIDRNGMRVRA